MVWVFTLTPARRKKNFVVLAASCCFSEQKFLENYQKIKIFWIKFSGHREKFS